MNRARIPSEDSLTVSQLNQWIKDVIQGHFSETVWVCGEIQGYDRNRNKAHVFFELVEKDRATRKIVARIGLVIFANRKFFIENTLKRAENAFVLKDDIEVRFACRVDFYAPHGAVRLIVESIDPVYTLGKLAQEKQRLIALLKEKGVLEKNKRLELSPLPLRIGLMTADDSAAYHDFRAELERSGFGFQVFFRSTIMQGEKTEEDICRAMDALERVKGLDALVITRGGGSLADLSCFDSQRLAERIAACRLPVLSGIGHEINTTITDLAAHTHAKTPTAIARVLVGRVEAFVEELERSLRAVLEGVKEILTNEKHRLKEHAHALQRGTGRFLKDHETRMVRLTAALADRSTGLLRDRRRQLDVAREQVARATRQRLEREGVKVRHYVKMVEMVHPVNTLKRGFSITRTARGRLVRSVKDVHPGDRIFTEVADGQIETVKEP